MKTRYSRRELLALWRSLQGFAPATDNPTGIICTDGLDLESRFAAEIDAWYSRLVHSAPPELLAPEELAGSFMLPAPVDGALVLSLPEGVVRVTCVKLSGWSCPARIVTDPHSPEARRQLHPFTRATATSPVAVFTAWGEVALYPATDFDVLDTLRCVIVRDDEYSFHPSALLHSQFSIFNSQLGNRVTV